MRVPMSRCPSPAVTLVGCAARRTGAPGAPQPGIGRPQYCSAAKDLQRSVATSSRQATSRGHARHRLPRGQLHQRRRAGRELATSAALAAAGVSGLAGALGHPDALEILKRGYGWGGTRLDGRNGAASWCGHGVFAHSLVRSALWQADPARTPPHPPGLSPRTFSGRSSSDV